MKRRSFLTTVAGAAGLATLPSALTCAPGKQGSSRPSFILITGDDLAYAAVGANGCPLEGVTPHIDALAGEGIRFDHSHATIAACQPSRSAVMTGLYPHNNGAMGFEEIRAGVTTVSGLLHDAGYRTGILGKVRHLKPVDSFRWDVTVHSKENLGHGRNPEMFGQATRTFLDEVKGRGVPFCLLVNSGDAHRPFAGTRGEINAYSGDPSYAPPPRRYRPEDMTIPGFLPDFPQVRNELADYHASVSRCDATVGEVVRALDESGLAENTVVLLISDHGMGFPFAKANCYLASTHIPTVIRWPARVEAGRVDGKHFISGIDFTPTLLEAAGLKPAAHLDGRSFLPLLDGESQAGRDVVFTAFHRNLLDEELPMRCIRSAEHGYIFNGWAGDTQFRSASEISRSLKAMNAAADDGNEEIRSRLDFLYNRAVEEFYDLKQDPYSLTNRIDAPQYRDTIDAMRQRLAAHLEAVGDPLIDLFRERVAL